MTFSELAIFLSELEKTPSRNEITRVLAELFKKATPSEIDKITYLLIGRISPQYTGIEFNFAERMMTRAIAQAYMRDVGDVEGKYKEAGDLGNVAEGLAQSLKRTAHRLSVEEVFKRLEKMANESGKDSQERKLIGIADLLKELDPLSCRYVVRIPVGKLRLGFSDITMLDALSVSQVGDKSARKQIEAAYSVTADIGKIAQRVKNDGLKGLEKVTSEPGVPIRSALAERIPSAAKLAEKLAPRFAIEPKFDGFRVQVHVWRVRGARQVRLFSRNLENVTPMFPEIVESALKLPVKNAIFDGEAIAYNPETGKFLPFQETVQRKRKYLITEKAKSLPLKVFLFDVLHLNGESVLNQPFAKRRKLLEKLDGKNKTILITDQKIVSKGKEIKKYFDEYIREGLEGIMAKKLDAPYQAGGRGYHWVKYKKHSEVVGKESVIADTIDCVLMGAYRGKGKRAKFGVGGFLVGIPGKGDKFYTISNLGTGLTDEQFHLMYKKVQELEVDIQPKEYIVDKQVVPDIWVKPKVVLEILADEITRSTRHTTGRVSDSDSNKKGYSLRFPRLIRMRDDKNLNQATSVKELEKLYKIQSRSM